MVRAVVDSLWGRIRTSVIGVDPLVIDKWKPMILSQKYKGTFRLKKKRIFKIMGKGAL